MKATTALLLLTITYSAESKWENTENNKYRGNYDSIEDQDHMLDPLQTNKIPMEKSYKIREFQKYYGKKNHNTRKEGYGKKIFYERKADSDQRNPYEVSRLDEPHWEYNYEDSKRKNYYKREKYYISRISIDQDPPNHTELIAMARYVMHNADWVSISTISTLPAIEGFPFTNIKSVVDGYINNSTGIPYFYMSPLDFTTRDLKVNNRATILVTLEETKFCASKEYDPQDPRCTRVMLSGKVKAVKNTTSEYEFARGALFERHPAMASYPLDHDFFVAKMKIAQIAMVDWFGGAKYIPVKDYLAFNNTQLNLSKH